MAASILLKNKEMPASITNKTIKGLIKYFNSRVYLLAGLSPLISFSPYFSSLALASLVLNPLSVVFNFSNTSVEEMFKKGVKREKVCLLSSGSIGERRENLGSRGKETLLRKNFLISGIPFLEKIEGLK
ncbi:hypothetical protein NCS13_1_1950 [Neochlamydia sp. S13]|nr:hypothetical protein NCS13_1_1950 [Neochlamydia sp. S13]